MKMRALVVMAALAGAAEAAPGGAKAASEASSAEEARTDEIAKYFHELEAMKLIDAESGNIDSLKRELAVAERLLHDGAFGSAAVALYAIVKSPRYAAFTDFVEYQNAEYDLGVALARSGSYGAALDVIEQTLRRGPSAPYWGPAHRRAVDIAIETRDHAGVLARIEAIKTSDPIPPSAAGERAYLRGRAAYDAGKLADAEAELMTITRKSRLYSSAVYLRGDRGQRQDHVRRRRPLLHGQGSGAPRPRPPRARTERVR
jgi:tetratricopeptide (TPR) repeat protein